MKIKRGESDSDPVVFSEGSASVKLYPTVNRIYRKNPATGVRELKSENSVAISVEDRAALENLSREGWWQLPDIREPMREPMLRAAAWYFLRARTARGTPIDSVARFHLGNGARLERLNFLGDTTENGIKRSYGLMVNYLYDLDHIEQNHEAFAEGRTVVASSAVKRFVRKTAANELVPAAG